MGRETKILLGLLGGLCCGLVAVLGVKLTLVRPPEGAGVDVHPPEPSAVAHITVEPPEYPVESPWDRPEALVSVPPAGFTAGSAGPATALAASPTEEASTPSSEAGAAMADGANMRSDSASGAMPPRTRFEGVRLAAAEAPAKEAAGAPVVGAGDDPRVGRSIPPQGREIRVGTAFAVAEGDTWWSIAEQAYGDGRWYRPLYAWNKTLDPRLSLRPGTRIVVPTQHELEAAWSSLVPQDVRGVGSVRGSAAAGEAPAVGEVVVREGDTLLSLAREHLGSASRWRDLHAWNRDRLQASPGPLTPGTPLRLEP